MKKKHLTLVVASLLVVFSILISYVIINTKEEKNTNTNVQIMFNSSDFKLASTDIEPGWKNTKTFTVINDSKSEYKINIMIKDLVNTFVTTGCLQYKITSTNNGYNMTEFKDIPKSDSARDEVLAYSVSVPAGTTQTYTIEFKYSNDDNIDQSEDVGMKLSGTLFITEGTAEPPTLYEQLLADKTERSVTTRPGGFSRVYISDNTKTLYTSTENGTTVYYFAGSATDNWAQFGGFYWRIIRTNADGGIRLLYHGTSTTAEDAYIGISAFNSTNNDSMYVGYMYGTSGTLASNRTNTNNSTIKTEIDSWYVKKLTNYTKYLSTTAIYCNDREVGSGTYSATGSSFYYKGYTRVNINTTPSYDCTNTSDAFSVSNSSAKLTYPIGLMTADEISFAGGAIYSTAPAYYYQNSAGNSSTGEKWWYTMTPYLWDGSLSGVFFVRGSNYPGYLYVTGVNGTGGARPVTSLKSCVKWSRGDGTADSPYTIDESYEC